MRLLIEVNANRKSFSVKPYHLVIFRLIINDLFDKFFSSCAEVSEPQANKRGSSLIGARTHFSSKRMEFVVAARSEGQGIVNMREWRN